jgi:ankyrin repeat protein
MSADHRDRVASIGRDLAGLARKEIGKAPPEAPLSADRALQARKDLTAMGLRYHDPAQFLDAVKRDDALAVELYLLGRGVNASAKGADGRTALEIARANGNERLAGLLSRNLPAAR